MRIKKLGDPHMGRTFNGLSLLARKYMQDQQELALRKSLDTEVDYHICMGDLFDKHSVDNKTVETVYTCYNQAAEQHPGTQYLILAGNHDVTNNSLKVSSLEILRKMLQHRKNITFVINQPHDEHTGTHRMLFVPYNPMVTYEEALESFHDEYNVIFTHWNTTNYGQDHIPVMPFERLAEITDHVINGHEHIAKTIHVGDLEVEGTGSMLPYGFSEDPTGKYFLTVHEDDMEGVDFKNKIVRIKYDGDVPPVLDGALHVTSLSTRDNRGEIVHLDDEFDLKNLFDKAMKDNDVSEEVQLELWAEYNDT